MNDFNALAQRYLDCWNETDPQARRAIVDEVYTEQARYVDPMAQAHGRQAISDTVGAVQEQLPGFRFGLVGKIDGHHDQARFGWECGPENSEPPFVGFDVIAVDGTGRVNAVFGFLDKVPAST